VAAEYVQFEVTDSYLSKNVRQYVMGGVHQVFHVTASKSEDEVGNLSRGVLLALVQR
jgi:hypothetical protein